MPVFALLVEFQGDPPSEELLAAHRDWLFPQFERGVFILTGGLEAVPGRSPSALAIMTADSIAAAESVIAGDPLVQAGRSVCQVVPYTVRVRAADLDTFFGDDTKAIDRTS
ncbi:YciI family protein [Kutzneria sp. NPDC051319]|uniref:YciI family protein n=1 Tax=Kutzneria sp. NPDC051319 TaxID=3155047 RepID=UPI00343DEDA1